MTFKIDERNLRDGAAKEGIARLVVGAVVVRGERVLLLRRRKEDFMGGIFELPSGKVEKGETLEGALRREVEEESGLKVAEITAYIGHFDYLSGSGKRTRQFNFAVKAVDGPVKLSEHDSAAWAGRKEIAEHPVTDSVKEILSLFWGAMAR